MTTPTVPRFDTGEPGVEPLLVPAAFHEALTRLNRLIVAYLETGMSEYEISRRLHGYQPPRPSAGDKDTWPPREPQP